MAESEVRVPPAQLRACIDLSTWRSGTGAGCQQLWQVQHFSTPEVSRLCCFGCGSMLQMAYLAFSVLAVTGCCLCMMLSTCMAVLDCFKKLEPSYIRQCEAMTSPG